MQTIETVRQEAGVGRSTFFFSFNDLYYFPMYVLNMLNSFYIKIETFLTIQSTSLPTRKVSLFWFRFTGGFQCTFDRIHIIFFIGTFIYLWANGGH